ncbi:MAG: hypothetical protein FJX74_16050, partial [Armatimonadetes bacterium]|nr:hypothetical protein [Armatimonadota bacterium]
MAQIRALSALTVLVGSTAAAAAPAPPIAYVELVGDTQLWTETRPVYETTDDARFQRERYGADFHVRLHGLPAGAYGLKIGLTELKFLTPGERVFSLTANRQALLRDFDILSEVAPGEALVKAFRIRLDEPVLDLHFAAQTDNAKFCFLRVYNDELAVEVLPDIPPARVRPGEEPDAPYLTGLFETSIGKFGSRVAFNPRPRTRAWWQGALGHADYAVAYFERDAQRWADAPYEMVFGTQQGPAAYALPFTEDLPAFSLIRQSITPTTLTYLCRAPDLSYEVEFTFSAPFYPQDLKLSTAPYLRLEATVRDRSGLGGEGTVYVGQARRAGSSVEPLDAPGLLGAVHHVRQFGKATQQAWATEAEVDVRPLAGEVEARRTRPTVEPAKLARDADGRLSVPVALWQPVDGLSWRFALEPGGVARRSFYHVGWCAEPVLEAPNRAYGFKYLEYFRSPAEVVRYAVDERDIIDRRTKLFEQTILGVEGLPPEFADFFSFAFQSWVMNT